MEVRKSEVEKILGYEISTGDFERALASAKRKQQRIYDREHRAEVLEQWYLVKLTEEIVRANALSLFTLEIGRTLYDMEKEHRLNEHGTPVHNHILPVPAL